MLKMILTINGLAEGWLKVMGAVLWQSALLIVIAALIVWCLRRSSPVVRYWLWQIVAIKLLLMPFWTFAIPLPSWWERSLPEQAAAVQSGEIFHNDSIGRIVEQPLHSAESPGAGVAHIPSRWENFGKITWQAWLLLIWFLIVFWQLVRLLLQRLRLSKLLKQTFPAGEEIAGLVGDLSGQIGLARVPDAVSVTVDCPLFVCGFWRPRLVLPGRLLASLDMAERRQVILHELGHVKRHDLAWRWPVEIARIIYFFNPLVYWVSYRLRLERELACDQLAMACSGHPPADYARTLVQVVSHASEPAAVQAAAIAAGLTGSEKRMRDEG